MGNTLNTLPNDFEIAVSSRTSKTYLKAEHLHNYYEIHYLIKGTAKYVVGEELFQMRSGDFLFVKKGLIHKTVCSPDSERTTICFTDEFINIKNTHILEKFGTQKYLNLPLLTKLEAENILQKMECEYNQKERYYLEICQCLLLELLFLFSRHIRSQKALSRSENVIEDAIIYINENYSTPITLTLLAEKYFVSSEYFSRIFKAHAGIGFKQFLNKIRLKHAEDLLKTGKYSVTEIAYKCGYNDCNYFSSLFKRVKGISPHKYIQS